MATACQHTTSRPGFVSPFQGFPREGGITFATYIAEELGLDLAVFRPHHEKTGAFCSNYATIANKKVVIVDDVIGTGETLKSAIKAVKSEKGNPVLCVCLLNKRSMNDVGWRTTSLVDSSSGTLNRMFLGISICIGRMF